VVEDNSDSPGPSPDPVDSPSFVDASAAIVAESEPAQANAMEDLLSLISEPALSAQPAVEEPSADLQAYEAKLIAKPSQPSNPTGGTSSPVLPSAQHFIVWLKQSIESRKLIINDAKALVHTVADTVYLVSPGVFQRYAQEHPQITALAKQEKVQEWQWVQKHFEKLLLHRKQHNGLNIWTCEVIGPRKSRQLHGYLLQDPRHLFDEVPPNNPYLRAP
jgi:hypothetical protein